MLTPFGNSPDANAYHTYGAAIGGSDAYVLDTVQGAKMAYSVRKLFSGYTGNYAKLRRGLDNAETNIVRLTKGFIGDNAITENGQTVADWLAGSQGTGTIWYDQSPTGLNAAQTTAANQYPLKSVFLQNRPAFTSLLLADFIWNYPTSIGNYLFGAGKQFTFHFVFKSNVFPSGDFRVFYFLGSDGPAIRGFTVMLGGVQPQGTFKINFIIGDLISYANLSPQNTYSNEKAYQLTVRYDGTINTSWQDRFKVSVNGINETTAPNTAVGVFPANLTNPLTIPRTWAAFSSVTNSGISEIILWDRLLSDTEVTFLNRNTQKAYGI